MFEFHWDPGPIFGVVVVLGLVALAFMIWMIVDVLSRPEADFSSPGAKTGWTVALILGLVFGFGFLGFILALVYFFAVRMPARARAGVKTWTAPGAPVSAAPRVPPAPQAPPTNCRNCGAKLVAGARFCHSCGAPAV